MWHMEKESSAEMMVPFLLQKFRRERNYHAKRVFSKSTHRYEKGTEKPV